MSPNAGKTPSLSLLAFKSYITNVQPFFETFSFKTCIFVKWIWYSFFYKQLVKKYKCVTSNICIVHVIFRMIEEYSFNFHGD